MLSSSVKDDLIKEEQLQLNQNSLPSQTISTIYSNVNNRKNQNININNLSVGSNHHSSPPYKNQDSQRIYLRNQIQSVPVIVDNIMSSKKDQSLQLPMPRTFGLSKNSQQNSETSQSQQQKRLTQGLFENSLNQSNTELVLDQQIKKSSKMKIKNKKEESQTGIIRCKNIKPNREPDSKDNYLDDGVQNNNRQKSESHLKQHNFIKQGKKLLSLQKLFSIVLMTFPFYVVEKLTKYNNLMDLEHFDLEKLKASATFILCLIMFINSFGLYFAVDYNIQRLRLTMMKKLTTEDHLWHILFLRVSVIANTIFLCRYKNKQIKENLNQILEFQKLLKQPSLEQKESGLQNNQVINDLEKLNNLQHQSLKNSNFHVNKQSSFKFLHRQSFLNQQSFIDVNPNTNHEKPSDFIEKVKAQNEIMRSYFGINQINNNIDALSFSQNAPQLQNNHKVPKNHPSSQSIYQMPIGFLNSQSSPLNSPQGNLTPLHYRKQIGEQNLLIDSNRNQILDKDQGYFKYMPTSQASDVQNTLQQLKASSNLGNPGNFIFNNQNYNTKRYSQQDIQAYTNEMQQQMNSQSALFTHMPSLSHFQDGGELHTLTDENEEIKEERKEDLRSLIHSSEQIHNQQRNQETQKLNANPQSHQQIQSAESETFFRKIVKALMRFGKLKTNQTKTDSRNQSNQIAENQIQDQEERKTINNSNNNNSESCINSIKQKNGTSQPNQRKNKRKVQIQHIQILPPQEREQSNNQQERDQSLNINIDQEMRQYTPPYRQQDSFQFEPNNPINILNQNQSQNQNPLQIQNQLSLNTPNLNNQNNQNQQTQPQKSVRTIAKSQSNNEYYQLHKNDSGIFKNLTIDQIKQHQIQQYKLNEQNKLKFQFEEVKFDKDLQSISDALDILGFLLLVSCMISTSFFRDVKFNEELETLFQRYAGYGYIVKTMISDNKARTATFFIFYCINQVPWDLPISPVVRYSHIFITTVFLHYLGFQNKFINIPKEERTHVKIDILQKNESNLKQLMQLIPYGIAVLNLDDIANYNKSFAKTIGIGKKKNQIIDALQRFQRKSKQKDEINKQNEASTENQDKNPKDDQKYNNESVAQLMSSQKSGKSPRQNTQTYTTLFDDLQYIKRSREAYFKDTNHIFDIYFVEKDEQQNQKTSKDQQMQDFNKTRERSHSLKRQGSRSRRHLDDRGNFKRNSKVEPHNNDHGNNSTNSNQSQGRKIYSISISPIVWLEKECLLITIKDITHEKVINQKQLMDKLRNMIFKSFSHELKTPLNGIIMSVDTSKFISKQLMMKIKKERKRGNLLLDDALLQSKQLKLQIKVMESCSYVLKNIMHDFFDYHQLQTNELSLNEKEFDLYTFIKDIKRIVKQQIKFDKIKFKCNIEIQNPSGLLQLGPQSNNQIALVSPIASVMTPQQQIHVKTSNSIKMYADKERLQQILLNLLMNSIKFTSKGCIELNVYISQTGQPPNALFRVRDTGIGIEDERLPYIFNLFEKDENSNLNDYINLTSKSARMGLPISQNLCQLMGGVIRVRSKINEGSVFSFRLPLNPKEVIKNKIAIQNQKINNILENTKSEFSQITSRGDFHDFSHQQHSFENPDGSKSPNHALQKHSSASQNGSFIEIQQLSNARKKVSKTPMLDKEGLNFTLQSNNMLTVYGSQNHDLNDEQRQKAIESKTPTKAYDTDCNNLTYQTKTSQFNPNNQNNNVQTLAIKQQQSDDQNTSSQRRPRHSKNPEINLQKFFNGDSDTNNVIQKDSQQQQQLSDEEEYCCKIDDDEEEELMEEEQEENVEDDDEEDDYGDEDNECIEGLDDEYGNEIDYYANQNNKNKKPRNQDEFIFKIQKKVGQFEFIFNSTRGKNNSGMNHGKDFELDDSINTPKLKHSSDNMDKYNQYNSSMATSNNIGRTALINYEKLKHKSQHMKDENFTFTAQVQIMEQERQELEKLKELRELDSASSKNSVTSSESENNDKQDKNKDKTQTLNIPKKEKKDIRRKSAFANFSGSKVKNQQAQNLNQEQRESNDVKSPQFRQKQFDQLEGTSQASNLNLNSNTLATTNVNQNGTQVTTHQNTLITVVTTSANNNNLKPALPRTKLQMMKQASLRQLVMKNKNIVVDTSTGQNQTDNKGYLMVGESQVKQLNTVNSPLTKKNRDSLEDGSYHYMHLTINRSQSNKISSKQVQNIINQNSQDTKVYENNDSAFAESNQQQNSINKNLSLNTQENNNQRNLLQSTSQAFNAESSYTFYKEPGGSSMKRSSISYSRMDSNKLQNRQNHLQQLANAQFQDGTGNYLNIPQRFDSSIQNALLDSQGPHLDLKNADDARTDSAGKYSSLGHGKSFLSNNQGTPISQIFYHEFNKQSSKQVQAFNPQPNTNNLNQDDIINEQSNSNNNRNRTNYLHIATKINSSIAASLGVRPLSPNSAKIKLPNIINEVFQDTETREKSHIKTGQNKELAKNEALLIPIINTSQNDDSQHSNQILNTQGSKNSQMSIQRQIWMKHREQRTFNNKSHKNGLSGLQKRMNFLGLTGISSSDKSTQQKLSRKNIHHPSQFSNRKQGILSMNSRSLSVAENNTVFQASRQLSSNMQTMKKQESSQFLQVGQTTIKPLHSYLRLTNKINQQNYINQNQDHDLTSLNSKISKKSVHNNSQANNLSLHNNHSDQKSSGGGTSANASHGDFRRKGSQTNFHLVEEISNQMLIAQHSNQKIISKENNKEYTSSNHIEELDAILLDSVKDVSSIYKQAMKNSAKNLLEKLMQEQIKFNEELDDRQEKLKRKISEEEKKEVVHSKNHSLKALSEDDDGHQHLLISEFDEDIQEILESERPSDIIYDNHNRDILSNVGRHLFSTSGHQKLKTDNSNPSSYLHTPMHSYHHQRFNSDIRKAQNNSAVSNCASQPAVFSKQLTLNPITQQQLASEQQFQLNQDLQNFEELHKHVIISGLPSLFLPDANEEGKGNHQDQNGIEMIRQNHSHNLERGQLNFKHKQHEIYKPMQEVMTTPRDSITERNRLIFINSQSNIYKSLEVTDQNIPIIVDKDESQMRRDDFTYFEIETQNKIDKKNKMIEQIKREMSDSDLINQKINIIEISPESQSSSVDGRQSSKQNRDSDQSSLLKEKLKLDSKFSKRVSSKMIEPQGSFKKTNDNNGLNLDGLESKNSNKSLTQSSWLRRKEKNQTFISFANSLKLSLNNNIDDIEEEEEKKFVDNETILEEKEPSTSIIYEKRTELSAIKRDLNQSLSAKGTKRSHNQNAFSFEPQQIGNMQQRLSIISNPQQNLTPYSNKNSSPFLSPLKLQNQLSQLRRQSLNCPKSSLPICEALPSLKPDRASSLHQNLQKSESYKQQPIKTAKKHLIPHQKQSKINLRDSLLLITSTPSVSQNQSQTQINKLEQIIQNQEQSEQISEFTLLVNRVSDNEKDHQSRLSQQRPSSQVQTSHLHVRESSKNQSPHLRLHFIPSQSDISNSYVKLNDETTLNFNSSVKEQPIIKRNKQLQKYQKKQTLPHLNVKSNNYSDSDSDSEKYQEYDQPLENLHQCPKIMVVDDVQMNRYAAEQMLSLIYKLKILQAENGQQAIETLINYYANKTCDCEGIKLILMDIEMPIMDGITATKQIKQLMNKKKQQMKMKSQAEESKDKIKDKNQSETQREIFLPSDLHIVALTAYMDEKSNCLKAGMSDFCKFSHFEFFQFQIMIISECIWISIHFVQLFVFLVTKPMSKSELEEILLKFKIIEL